MQTRVIASISPYNDVLFFEYAMRAIEPYVDEIIITDSAVKSALEMGWPPRSVGLARTVIDKWIDNKKIFLAPLPPSPPEGREHALPGFNMAKEHGADWYFTVGCDEIWSPEAMKFMKTYLQICDRKGILGLNVSMFLFAPDFWHVKEFRNPRLARVTPDSTICFGGGSADAVCWPGRRLYQYAGDLSTYAPPGTPAEVLRVNADFPKNLKVFHYSCVGQERIESKVNFYKHFNGTSCDQYCEAYMKKNWIAFPDMGFKEFHGKHPDIMTEHPLFKERLY